MKINKVEDAELLANQLGEQCRHIIVPDTSHNLIWEKTEVVMHHIKYFLNGL